MAVWAAVLTGTWLLGFRGFNRQVPGAGTETNALLLLLLFTFYDCTRGRFCRGGMIITHDSMHSTKVLLRNGTEEDAGWIYTFWLNDRPFWHLTHPAWNRMDLESAMHSWQATESLGEAKDGWIGYVHFWMKESYCRYCTGW